LKKTPKGRGYTWHCEDCDSSSEESGSDDSEDDSSSDSDDETSNVKYEDARDDLTNVHTYTNGNDNGVALPT